MPIEPVVLGPAVDNAYRLANGLLQAAARSLDVNVPSTQPAPKRQFVYHGDPPYDETDMLAVYVDQPRPSQVFPEVYAGPILTPFFWVADFIVTLVRPYPYGVDQQGRLIDQDVLSEASRIVYADGLCVYWSIVVTLKELRDHGVFDYYTFSPLKPVAAEGGSAGWAFTVTTELSGDCSALADNSS